MNTKLQIGLDVSKEHIDYLAMDSGTTWAGLQQHSIFRVENTEESLVDFLSLWSVGRARFILEPTGTYSDKVIQLLLKAGHVFSVVTPSKAHHFSQTMGITTKNDAQSARLLAYMGDRLELPLYQPPSEQMAKRKQLLAALAGLEKHLRMLSNQKHAQEQYLQPQEVILQIYERQIKAIEEDILILNEQVKELDDQAFKEAKKLLKTIVGIGEVTATWLLVITQGLDNFYTPGQLIKYCGLVGRTHQSGSSVNTSQGITKQASAKLRAALFMAAKSAIRYNHACKELYQRLRAKGKPYFKAMMAVMAKLLKQAFGVIKSGKEFDNDYYLKYQKN